MGFLNDFLKSTVSRVVNDAAHSAMDAIKENIAPANASSDSTNRTSSDHAADPLQNADAYKKLRVILAQEFPQYEVKEKVSAVTLGGSDCFMPYDFAVYEAGVPKLFIMVVYNNTCASKSYRQSRELCESQGITLINFVYAFENKPEYITNRLHEYL